MKALIISFDNFEDLELLVPYYRLKEAGIDVDIASIHKSTITGIHDYKVAVDMTLEEVNPDDYSMLVLPGGKAPQAIRNDSMAKEITRNFFIHNKPVGAICHGPQILISADLLKGRHATSYISVAKEMKSAGAIYEDKDVVVDGNLITSRGPSDLPAFMRETMRMLAKV